MPIISKTTWDSIPQEEKDQLKELYSNSVKVDLGVMIKIFPEEALHPTPLTYENVARELFKEHRLGAISIEIPTFSDKEAEKLSAIGALLATAKFLNGDWKPDWDYVQDKWYLAVEKGKVKVDYHDDGHNSHIVYFRTQQLAQQAIQILGEDTVRLALTTEY